MTKLQKPRIPKRFYFLTTLIYLPIFYCLAVIGARWYGFVIAGLSCACLLGFRRRAHWPWPYMFLFLLLAFMVAFSGLYLSRPRRDVSLPGQVGTGTLQLFIRLPVDKSLKTGDEFSEIEVWKPREGYTHSVIQLPACTMEALVKGDGGADVAVLQLHGGAYVSGLNDLYRTMADRYSDDTGGGSVYTLDYRLAPQYPYPSQQNDAMDAWNYLTTVLGYAPGHILVAGDSAGGNLALNLGLRLRDEGKAMPMAFIGFSPWADLSNSGESHIKNAVSDPTFGVPKGKYDGVTPVGVPTTYTEGLNPKNPYVSPSFGDYAGFPPMLLQAGDLEVLLSDSQAVYENAVSHGVDCTLTVYPGMFHVFQGSLDLLPESRKAWDEVQAFVQRVMWEAGLR